MTFHGICSYPHGGRISGALLLTMAVAAVCTCVSMASCRFARLEYTSDQGNFDEHFVSQAGSSSNATYQVGIGLFNWLRPYSYVTAEGDEFIDTSNMDWRQGACVGYTNLQVDAFLNLPSEGVRIVGVLSVLAALSTFGFSWFVACMALRNFQRYLLAICCFSVAILNGCTLVLPQSGLCTQIGNAPNCRLDQGALVAIGAVIFWIASGLLASFYMEAVDHDGFHDRMRNQRQANLKQEKKQQRRRRPRAVETNMDWNHTSNHRRSSSAGRSKRNKKLKRSSTTPTTVSSSHSTPRSSTPRNATTTLIMPDNSLEVLAGYKKPRRTNSTPANHNMRASTSRTIPHGSSDLPRRQPRTARASTPVDLDATPEPSTASSSNNSSSRDKYRPAVASDYVMEVPRSSSMDAESERWSRARQQQQQQRNHTSSSIARRAAIDLELEQQDKKSGGGWFW